MAQIDKETKIIDALELDERIAGFFFASGMHCVGCSAARGESIEEACMVHGIDADELVEKINEFLETK